MVNIWKEMYGRINRGYFMVTRRYKILSLITEKYFSTQGEKFQVMFSLLYKHQWNTKPFFTLIFLCRFLWDDSNKGGIYYITMAKVTFFRVKIYLLLTELEGRTVSYRRCFFHFNLWPKWEEGVPWIEEETRCHNLQYKARKQG